MFTNCLQLVNHTSDSSLPIKGKSSDGLLAEVLTGSYKVKLTKAVSPGLDIYSLTSVNIPII